MKVEVRKLAIDSNAEFGLADTNEGHTAYKFAQYLNDHFEELAAEIPEFQRLKQIALLISLAEFFRDTLKVPKDMLNLDLLKLRIPTVQNFYPNDRVPRLSRKEDRIEDGYTITLIVTGGVSMVTQTREPQYKPELVEYINRNAEYLTPFEITHFDYMKKLLDYSEESDNSTETASSLYAVTLFTPQSCSDEYCNNLVIFDSKNVDPFDSLNVYDEISPYSYQGKIYCQQHHPFRCCREKCPKKIIGPGEAYAELEFGKFHGECLICEECGKAVLNNFAYKNGFFHSQCLTQLKKAGNTEKIKQKNDEESKRAYQGEKTRQDEKNMSIEKQKNIEEEKKSMVSGNVDGINNDKIKKIEDKTEEKKAEELRPAETNITNIQETSKIAPTKVSGIKEEAKNTNKIKSSQIAAKVGEASNEKNKKSQVAKVENAAKKNQDCVIRKKNQNNPGALPAKKK